jgi:hypothetical protein
MLNEKTPTVGDKWEMRSRLTARLLGAQRNFSDSSFDQFGLVKNIENDH